MVVAVCTACPGLCLPQDFYLRRDGRRASGNKCKSCVKSGRKAEYKLDHGAGYRRRKNNRTAMTRYGITLAERDALAASQGGRCAICREKTDRLCVDHDHATGMVRAMLCNRCNVGVGVIESSLYEDMLAYVADHRGGEPSCA